MTIIGKIKLFMNKIGKTPKKASSSSLIGKVVAVDSKYRSGDGQILVHVYVISSSNGEVGMFIGNLKRINKFMLWRPSGHNHSPESIPNQRILTLEESRILSRSGISNFRK